MLISNKLMNELEKRIIGKELSIELIYEELKKMGFKKVPNIVIRSGYKDRNENIGWVTIAICNCEKRVKLNNLGVVVNE